MVENRFLSLGTKHYMRSYGTEAKNATGADGDESGEGSEEASGEEVQERKVPPFLLPFKDAKTRIFASGKPDRVLY